MLAVARLPRRRRAALGLAIAVAAFLVAVVAVSRPIDREAHDVKACPDLRPRRPVNAEQIRRIRALEAELDAPPRSP